MHFSRYILLQISFHEYHGSCAARAPSVRPCLQGRLTKLRKEEGSAALSSSAQLNEHAAAAASILSHGATEGTHGEVELGGRVALSLSKSDCCQSC